MIGGLNNLTRLYKITATQCVVHTTHTIIIFIYCMRTI